MFTLYLKVAWRNLGKQRTVTFINLLGLSIGMCAAVLIFMWVQNELSFDNYHKRGENIFRTKVSLQVDKEQTWLWENSPYLLGEQAKMELPEIRKVARLRPRVYDAPYFYVNNQYFKEERCAIVDEEWFNVFDYQFKYGGPENFHDGPYNMILTETKAKKYFGNEYPVGKTIKVDTNNYIVHAVIKDNPPNSSFQYDAIFSFVTRRNDPNNKRNDESWGNFNYMTFFELTPNADQGVVTRKLKEIMGRNRENDKSSFQLVNIKDIHFENDLQSSHLMHGKRKMVNVFIVLGVILLVIACINYVNLTTAKATVRLKEVSIKKIVGAPRLQLFIQFVIESLLVSLLALGLTLAVIYLVLPYFNAFTERSFSLSLSSAAVWYIVGGTLITTIILTSIYPALLLSSFQPMSIFRGVNIFRMKDGMLRKVLVVLQFTISIALIIGTLIIYRQMNYISMKHSTYDRSQMFTFSLPWKVFKQEDEQRISLANTIKNELVTTSSINNVTLMNQPTVVNMTGLSSGSSNDWEGRDKDFMPAIAFFHGDTNLTKMLNLELKEGRWFNAEASDKHNSILNETAVHEFGIKRPVIGQRFVSQGDTGVIIGIVKDFFYKSMHEKIGPVVIRNDNYWSSTYMVSAEPGKAVDALNAAKNVWSKFFPGEPFSFKFLNEEFNVLYKSDRKTSALIWIFSCLAILISCLGLYALAAFTAEKRSKEISIRKVLGADISVIVSLLSRDFIMLVMVALVMASPIAWYGMNKWLQQFAYRIEIGWLVFVLSGIIALLIAFLSIGVNAIKAATNNPIKALRTE